MPRDFIATDRCSWDARICKEDLCASAYHVGSRAGSVCAAHPPIEISAVVRGVRPDVQRGCGASS